MELFFWIIFLTVIGYYGYKQYRERKRENFEDRDN
jgi:hypothetical protein